MKKSTISEIESQLNEIHTELDPAFQDFLKDERKGVQGLIAKWRKLQEHEQSLREKFEEMNVFEKEWRKKGYLNIAGVDEVGRGPLAGPVVTAAVILPENFFLPGLDDSKKLSENKREEYDSIIRREAVAVSVGIISAEEIDRINIYEATKKAMLAAVAGLETEPDFLLIDAMRLETPYGSQSIIKGDERSVSIAAASVIAKVARDRMMNDVAKSYPGYGFERHMGYGTKEHLEAIKKLGITPYHRRSFAPIKNF